MDEINVLMIGAGRMAEAVISGLKKKSKENKNIVRITVANRSNTNKLLKLKDKYGIHITDNWVKEISGHQVILLASPPETQEEQLRSMTSHIHDQVIITFAAGLDPTYLEQRLPEGTATAWIMPNTAAEIGMSMSIYTCGKHVLPTHRNRIQLILQAIGEGEELSEEEVHRLTAITGSGPAFFYTFVQAMEKEAVENGASSEQAKKLVTTMLKGSIAMLEQGISSETLISQVASPGGSTAEGLKVLKEADFHGMMKKAVDATNEHARKQGEEQ